MYGNGITRSAARDIRSVVGKVLLDLSNPEPPLRPRPTRTLGWIGRLGANCAFWFFCDDLWVLFCFQLLFASHLS